MVFSYKKNAGRNKVPSCVRCKSTTSVWDWGCEKHDDTKNQTDSRDCAPMVRRMDSTSDTPPIHSNEVGEWKLEESYTGNSADSVLGTCFD